MTTGHHRPCSAFLTNYLSKSHMAWVSGTWTASMSLANYYLDEITAREVITRMKSCAWQSHHLLTINGKRGDYNTDLDKLSVGEWNLVWPYRICVESTCRKALPTWPVFQKKTNILDPLTWHLTWTLVSSVIYIAPLSMYSLTL